ncbi:MAG: hypothetical protein IT376_14340 [Polyangiaceae bacterium]|nr:hypothetical protein [Polyangiaceae bacterium]
MSAAARSRVSPATARRFGWLLALSVMFHLPLTPLGALLGLAGLLIESSESISDDAAQEFDIPVEIEGVSAAAAAGAATPPSSPPPPTPDDDDDDDDDDDEPPAAPRPAPRPKPPARPDGGAPRDAAPDGDAAARPDAPPPAGADAGPPDAADAAPAVALATDAGGADAGVASARPGRDRDVGDPVALSGAAGKVADAKAPVRLILYLDRIRSHPHGGRVGAMLGSAYQWRDFFEGSGLDPVQDLDRILIAGPQLRVSSHVVAVVQHRLTDARARQAIDGLVRRDPARSRWLEGSTPVAEIWADRAARVVALPSPKLLVIAPPALRKQAAAVRGRFPAGEAGVVLTTYVAEPWKAFQGIPFEIPRTVSWVRMKVVLEADGGATAVVEAADADEASARANARDLERRLDALLQVRGVMSLLAGGRTRLLERPSFVSRGDRIHGEVRATPDQLSYLLGLVARVAREIADERARAAQRERDASGGSAPAGSTPRGGASSRAGPPPPAGSGAR